MLLTFLIIFFASIVLYNWIQWMISNKMIEGMDNGSNNASKNANNYEPYDKNDPNNCMILAQQNAGNIDYLKSRMDEVANVKNDVNTMQQSMNSMQVQLDGLVQQNSNIASEIAGGSEPVNVSGLEKDDDE